MFSGYEGVVENEEANNVAREASSQEGRLLALVRERVREVGGSELVGLDCYWIGWRLATIGWIGRA
jgi:hypothetical protein